MDQPTAVPSPIAEQNVLWGWDISNVPRSDALPAVREGGMSSHSSVISGAEEAAQDAESSGWKGEEAHAAS